MSQASTEITEMIWDLKKQKEGLKLLFPLKDTQTGFSGGRLSFCASVGVCVCGGICTNSRRPADSATVHRLFVL